MCWKHGSLYHQLCRLVDTLVSSNLRQPKLSLRYFHQALNTHLFRWWLWHLITRCFFGVVNKCTHSLTIYAGVFIERGEFSLIYTAGQHWIVSEETLYQTQDLAQPMYVYTLWGKKLHPCSFCNNLIKLRSSMPIFCKQLLECICNKTVQKFHICWPSMFYSTKFNRRAKNCSTTRAKTLKVMTG